MFGCYKIKSVETLIILGKSKLEEGDFDGALDLFQQAILLDQNDPIGSVRMISALFALFTFSNVNKIERFDYLRPLIELESAQSIYVWFFQR